MRFFSHDHTALGTCDLGSMPDHTGTPRFIETRLLPGPGLAPFVGLGTPPPPRPLEICCSKIYTNNYLVKSTRKTDINRAEQKTSEVKSIPRCLKSKDQRPTQTLEVSMQRFLFCRNLVSPSHIERTLFHHVPRSGMDTTCPSPGRRSSHLCQSDRWAMPKVKHSSNSKP